MNEIAKCEKCGKPTISALMDWRGKRCIDCETMTEIYGRQFCARFCFALLDVMKTKKFQCHYCGRQMKRSATLWNRHDRVFMCDQCEAGHPWGQQLPRAGNAFRERWR